MTPYFRFFMEKRAKYAKLHPEMSNLDLTKILSKKYRELPDKKKVCRKAHSSAYFCDTCHHLVQFIMISFHFMSTEKIR